jgi:hypothetical protein
MFVPGQENSVIFEHTQQSVSSNGASVLGWLMALFIVNEYRLFQAPSAYFRV